MSISVDLPRPASPAPSISRTTSTGRTGLWRQRERWRKKRGVKKEKELLWAWGDDSSKTKGLWRRALIQHDSPSNIEYNDPSFKLGSPKAEIAHSAPVTVAKTKR